MTIDPNSYGVNSSILQHTAVGRVLTVYAAEPTYVRRALVNEAEAVAPGKTVVSVHWQQAPALDLELHQVLRTMAEAARDLWPRWYATVEERFEFEQWPTTELELRLNDARTKTGNVSAAWFRKAWRCCQEGSLPVVKGMTPAEQLRQLSLAMDPSGPIVMLAVSGGQASPIRVHSLARASEWLATQTEAPVVLVVPEEWSKYNEMDVVNYEPIYWQTEEDNSCDEDPRLPPHEPQVLVEPCIGRPHPCSDVEQRLYDRLMMDPELSPLFQFNRRTTGYQGVSYRVDLLWAQGLVVIEIDGHDHCKILKYHEDRERDYRLLLAGYTVLRITNEDVIADTARVLEKIRKVVHLRQPQGGNGI